MMLFDLEHDTLAVDTCAVFTETHHVKSNWTPAFTRHRCEWTDKTGARHFARYDEYPVEDIAPASGQSKYRAPVRDERKEIETSTTMEISALESAIKSHLGETPVSDRTSTPPRFIWGGRWGR